MGNEKDQNKKVMAMGDRAILPEGARTIPIYVMGKRYEVPETLTILKAMEYAGFKFLRGCGCRGGICGACSTVYRKAGDYKLQVGLACQTVVETEMYLAQIPFYPANRAIYSFKELKPVGEEIFKLYPEIFRCVACNACSKVCPMDVKVMDYIAALKRGDIARAAKLSFDCIQCGMCASRCMGEISQYHIAQVARRIYGGKIMPRSGHLAKRVQEIAAGKYDGILTQLQKMDQKEMEKLYVGREREPDDSIPGQWMPKDRQYI